MFLVEAVNGFASPGARRRNAGLPEAPLRDELLSVERLDDLARTLAARFITDPSRRASKSVFPRFDDNVRVLKHAYEEAIRSEHQREAAAQISATNLFTSLRPCSTLDWSTFFEAVSPVERVLQQDPAGVHARQDFLTRDRYRRTVEELADLIGRGRPDLEADPIVDDGATHEVRVVMGRPA